LIEDEGQVPFKRKSLNEMSFGRMSFCEKSPDEKSSLFRRKVWPFLLNPRQEKETINPTVQENDSLTVLAAHAQKKGGLRSFLVDGTN